ncbi:MAG: hypothetical protein V9E88_00340 [Ferruginibacter sp.]
MMSKRPLVISPMQLQQNDVLTVYSPDGNFRDNDYMITNEEGRVIRKGSISANLSEFKLRIVGLKAGVYRLVMGQYQEKFIVSA